MSRDEQQISETQRSDGDAERATADRLEAGAQMYAYARQAGWGEHAAQSAARLARALRAASQKVPLFGEH